MEDKNLGQQDNDNLDSILSEYGTDKKDENIENVTLEKKNISQNNINNRPKDKLTQNLQSSYRYYNATVEHREKSLLSKPVITISIILFILVALTALYCMFYDALNVPQSMKNATIDDNSTYQSQEQAENTKDNANQNTNDNKPTVVIVPENKPNVSADLKDENGRYTTEGVATVVRPSIVEIFNYATGNKITPIGSGSGIIISTDGYIVTNAHVLEDAGSLRVTLSDDTEYDAKIIGRDTKTDIAVIKIEATGLTNAVIGNSDEVKLGEQVMAIGNPGGLTGSITGGYVSGLNRPIKTDTTGYEMNCIQTDAAISPGNSGGALVNMYGQVIGITSSKYVDSSFEGLGFAITINEAKPVIEELISNGYITGRIKIGIVFYSINDYTAQMNNCPVGILVTDIDEKCDVANTDLKVEDIITKVEGQTVYDYDTLFNALQYKKPGDSVTATVVRIDSNTGDQKTFDITFKLMEDNPSSTSTNTSINK